MTITFAFAKLINYSEPPFWTIYTTLTYTMSTVEDLEGIPWVPWVPWKPLLKVCLCIYLISLHKHNYIHYGPHWRYTEASNTMTRFGSRLSNSCYFTFKRHQKRSQKCKVKNFLGGKGGACLQTPCIVCFITLHVLYYALQAL